MKTFAQINETVTNEINEVVSTMDLVDQMRISIATTQAILDGLSHCKSNPTVEDYKGAIVRTTRVATIMGLIDPSRMNELTEALECPTFVSHWDMMQGMIAESGVSLYASVLETNKMLKEALLSL